MEAGINHADFTRGARVRFGDEQLRVVATVQSDIGPLTVVAHDDADAAPICVLVPQADLVTDGSLTPEQADEDRENAGTTTVPVATDVTDAPDTSWEDQARAAGWTTPDAVTPAPTAPTDGASA